MRVNLGIDASLTRTALAWHAEGPDGPVRRSHRVATTKPDQPLLYRLQSLARATFEVVRDLQVDPALSLVVAIEEPGFVPRKGAMTTPGQLGEARGAIVAGLPAFNCRLLKVTVGLVRSDLGIKAKRGEAKEAVVAWLEERGIAVPTLPGGGSDYDVADALALAEWAGRQ